MILVTGGAGFIGSNLLVALETEGHSNLICCDWLDQQEKWRNIAKRELADIVAPEALFSWLETHSKDVEIVFHLGAISSTTETDADLVIERNFRTSLRLWEWCSQHNVPLIYASSAATYGNGMQGFKAAMEPEQLARMQPLNLYGWSKHLFDRRVCRLARSGSVSRPPYWAGLKFFNVYGPNEYHKGNMRSVVCTLHEQLSAGGSVKLFRSYHRDYPDGGQLRDFIHVQDCVQVLMYVFKQGKKLLRATEYGGTLLNVGTGRAHSFLELAQALFAAHGQPVDIDYIDMPEAIRDRYQYYTQADISGLVHLGYRESMLSLEEGVAHYVQHYLTQADPYR